MYMTKLIVGIDLQNDFITGKLGSKDAQAIVPKITDYLNSLVCNDENEMMYAVFTMDTHFNQDSKNPIDSKFTKHCLKNTDGWLINNEILSIFNYNVDYVEKSSYAVNDKFKKIYDGNYTEIVIFGLCTDICVIANAIEFYKLYPMSKITIMSELCAGTTVENHNMALHLMKVMGFDVI